MVRSAATARPRLPRRAGPGAGTHVYTSLDERRCALAVCKVRSWWLGPFLASGLFWRINGDCKEACFLGVMTKTMGRVIFIAWTLESAQSHSSPGVA